MPKTASNYELLSECVEMLEKYYVQVKNMKRSDPNISLRGEDMTIWKKQYFPNLVETGIVMDYQWFDEKRPNYGIGDDGIFSKVEYCQFMYRAYKLLAQRHIDNKAARYILECIYFLEKYVPLLDHSDGGTKLVTFDALDMETWNTDYYLYLSKSDLIPDRSFFAEGGEPGIGEDGIFDACDLFHFLFECYKYVYRMRELPVWKALVLHCTDVTNGKIHAHPSKDDGYYVLKNAERMAKFLFAFSGGNVILDIDFQTITREVTLAKDGDSHWWLDCTCIKEELDIWAPNKTKDLVITFTRYGEIPTKGWLGLASGIHGYANQAGYITLKMLDPHSSYMETSLNAPPRYIPHPEELYVHETLHILDFFYSSKYGKIPNPDCAEQYKYPCMNPGGCHGYYKFYQDALSARVIDSDGSKIGIKPDMWKYSPSNT